MAAVLVEDAEELARLVEREPALYAGRIPASNRWLLRFRMGPLEWVCRTLTCGRTPPRRKNAAPGAATSKTGKR